MFTDDFWNFRRMAMPSVLQVLFWFELLAVMVGSAALIAFGLHNHLWWVAVAGIGVLVIGPLVVRLLTESMIVVFRINETLTDLRSLAMWGADQASAQLGGAWQDPSPSTATRAT